MSTIPSSPDPQKRQFLPCLLLSACCILLNFVLRNLAGLLGVPLYLDCVGTILAGVLGGYLPGVLVGYISNLVLDITSETAKYYGVVSILIAALATYLGKKGWFRSLGKALLSVPLFALLGGGVGSILTFGLYGRGNGAELSKDLVAFLQANGLQNIFWSQFLGDFLIDLADKLATVLLAFLILHFIAASPGITRSAGSPSGPSS